MFNYYFFVNIITGDIMLYFLIFISKVVELTLGTLRMIVVANGKKVLGSFLQGVISLIWVFAISNVITNLKDPLNIIFFCFRFNYRLLFRRITRRNNRTRH